jgi:hypothetical protein
MEVQMRKLSARRPSPALVISMVALFVAMGGTGYAALKLPKNSVGSKQIRTGAVGSSEVKNGSLTKKDFRAGQIPAGPRGLAGPAGTKWHQRPRRRDRPARSERRLGEY